MFMTQDERDLVQGRRLRELGEAKSQLQDIQISADKIADDLVKCADALRQGVQLPMSCPSYEEILALVDKRKETEAMLSCLAQPKLVDAD